MVAAREETPTRRCKRVAVVGSGITGLSTAWLLQRSGVKVVLFEREATCGGHTLTDTSGPVPVDLGFQVYNLTTYPHLVGLLEALGVDTEPSDMSFALSSDGGAFEWGSRSLGALFCQRRNLVSPTFWRMVADVVRFGRGAPEVLDPAHAAQFSSMTTGEYLRLRRYSQPFVRHYFLPMCAAVWSVPEAQMLDAPITTLIRFWANHHLLDLVQRPVWRVVKDRSRSYVNAICAELRDVRTGCPVEAVESLGAAGPVRVRTAAGKAEDFDAVVLATHTNTSLAMLGGACTPEVRDVLAAIPYNDNEVWLHTDASLMPRSRAAWASWNFLGSSEAGSERAAVCVSYWLNLLQNLPPGTPDMFVTLNPPHPPAAAAVLRRLTLAHPVFGPDMVAAQAALPSVQGNGGVYLAGAWAGFGFHEDGLKAGIAVAQALGASIPWTPRAASPKVGFLGSLAMNVFNRFARAAISVGHLRVILPNGEELSYGDPATIEPPVAPGEEWRQRPKLKAVIRLFSYAFFRKIITRHDTGMGESYMDGDYEVDDLGGLLAVACANANNIEASRGLLGFLNTLGGWALRAAHAARSNTIAGSRRNIEEHYDAGNDMYRLFLDDTLTYSCGIHTPGGTLREAQIAKLDAMLAAAEVCATDHVLEIGCGWGSMAIRAVQTTGCRWTGITVSKEQLAEATARVKAAGLSDRITLLFCDYREIPAETCSFDKVVSCEMIEAVGQEHLVTYFAAIDAALKPGGKAIIQVIAEPDERYEAYCASSDFIREHIFPGGHLPSMGAMVQAARGTSLQVHDCKDIGPHYAVTLREWRAAWEARHDAVLKLGYSERFWRKYRFYFAYCEAAFDARYIHDFHVLWVKGAGGRGVASAAAPGATLAEAIAEPSRRPSSPDPMTQLLLGIYFFLAGWAVGQRRAVLLVPVASAACAALLYAVSLLSGLLSPRYRGMEPEARVWFCSDIVHLLYSAGASAAAATYLASEPAALNVGAPPAATAAPDAIVCVSAGFCAFLLWILVAYRIYQRSYLKMLHLATVLVLFAAAAFKSDHTALLAATLVSEAHTALFLVRRLQDATGVSAVSPWRRAVATAERASLVAFRLLPHAALTVLVAAQPAAFATRARYGMATAGLLYMNLTNVLKARRTFGGAATAGPKVKAG